MITAKEKAIDLVKRFENENLMFEVDILQDAKESALITVSEIASIFYESTPKDDPYCYLMSLEYWQDVKEEIEKLEKIPA